MNVVIGSAFRDMAGRTNRYFKRAYALEQHLDEEHLRAKHSLRIVAVEGDSIDGTAAELAHMAELWEIPTDVRHHHHGHPHFGSTESPVRLEALTGVSNEVFAGVLKTDDVLVYVESDLLWRPETMAELAAMAHRQADGFDIIAPLTFAAEAFYDIWGYRGTDSQRFGPFAPFHESLPEHGIGEIHSAGSCLVMRAEVARTVHNDSANALVGWCAAARQAGYRIGCAVDYRIDHPA